MIQFDNVKIWLITKQYFAVQKQLQRLFLDSIIPIFTHYDSKSPYISLAYNIAFLSIILERRFKIN